MTTPTDPTRPAGYPGDPSVRGGTEPAAFGAETTGGARESSGASLKEAGRETTDTAKGEARRVAASAGEQASQVTQEAGTQVRRLMDEGLTEARTQSDTQMTRLGGRLREIADEMSQMANGSEQHGVASQFAGELAGRGERLADWLENHGPDEALDQVRRYARRNPTTFLALAAGAGLVVGRFARALQAGEPDQASGTGSTAGAPGSTYSATGGTASGPYRAETTPYDPTVRPSPGPAAAGRRLDETVEPWDDQR